MLSLWSLPMLLIQGDFKNQHFCGRSQSQETKRVRESLKATQRAQPELSESLGGSALQLSSPPDSTAFISPEASQEAPAKRKQQSMESAPRAWSPELPGQTHRLTETLLELMIQFPVF